jgi:hypothetical protein
MKLDTGLLSEKPSRPSHLNWIVLMSPCYEDLLPLSVDLEFNLLSMYQDKNIANTKF